MTYLLIIASVALSSIAQLLLKLGMTSPSVKSVLGGSNLASMIVAIGLNPLVFAGLALYFLGAVIWLFVLSRVPLNVAYPFVALGFLLTAVLAYVILNESIQMTTVLGTTLIVVGVIVLSRGVIVAP